MSPSWYCDFSVPDGVISRKTRTTSIYNSDTLFFWCHLHYTTPAETNGTLTPLSSTLGHFKPKKKKKKTEREKPAKDGYVLSPTIETVKARLRGNKFLELMNRRKDGRTGWDVCRVVRHLLSLNLRCRGSTVDRKPSACFWDPPFLLPCEIRLFSSFLFRRNAVALTRIFPFSSEFSGRNESKSGKLRNRGKHREKFRKNSEEI